MAKLPSVKPYQPGMMNRLRRHLRIPAPPAELDAFGQFSIKRRPAAADGVLWACTLVANVRRFLSERRRSYGDPALLLTAATHAPKKLLFPLGAVMSAHRQPVEYWWARYALPAIHAAKSVASSWPVCSSFGARPGAVGGGNLPAVLDFSANWLPLERRR